MLFAWACDPYLKSNRPRFSPISTCSFTGNAKSSTKSKRWLLQTLRSDGTCMTDITTWFRAVCIDHPHIIVTTYWLTESTHKSTSEARPFSFPYHPMTPDLQWETRLIIFLQNIKDIQSSISGKMGEHLTTSGWVLFGMSDSSGIISSALACFWACISRTLWYSVKWQSLQLV